MTSTSSARRWMTRDTSCVYLLTLAAAAVRWANLAAQSFWFDEAFSWLCASAPLVTGLRFALINFVHPPLYYLLLRPFAALHHSEYVLRWPSAASGVIAVPVAYQVGRRLAGKGTGLMVAALLALNPFHVWYSREARMYALAFLLALLCGYLFQRTFTHWRVRDWVALGVVSGLAYATHYFCLLLPLTQFVYLLLDFRRRYRMLRPWTLTQVLAGLPLLPWFCLLFSQPEQGLTVGWIPRPRLWDPLLTLWNFSSLPGSDRLGIWAALGLVPFIVGLGWGLQPNPRRLWWALWLAWPLLFTLGLSWGLRRYFYVDRYLVVCLPACLLLVAWGMASLPGPWLRRVVVAVLLVASLVNVVRVHLDPALTKEEWRSASQYVSAHALPDDQVVLRNVEEIVILDYYGSELPRAVLEPLPDHVWAELEAEGGRLWLIYLHTGASAHLVTKPWPFDVYRDADPATVAWLAAHREAVVEHHPLAGVDLLLLDTSPR
jgi:mannosyltransferase